MNLFPGDNYQSQAADEYDTPQRDIDPEGHVNQRWLSLLESEARFLNGPGEYIDEEIPWRLLEQSESIHFEAIFTLSQAVTSYETFTIERLLRICSSNAQASTTMYDATTYEQLFWFHSSFLRRSWFNRVSRRAECPFCNWMDLFSESEHVDREYLYGERILFSEDGSVPCECPPPNSCFHHYCIKKVQDSNVLFFGGSLQATRGEARLYTDEGKRVRGRRMEQRRPPGGFRQILREPAARREPPEFPLSATKRTHHIPPAFICISNDFPVLACFPVFFSINLLALTPTFTVICGCSSHLLLRNTLVA
ncbi:unnamed protein product [Caenorhabditis auriculariae]|uniref:Uncharacterized protein n=1 Tax=Caenorhabditis auriculariae TaxID=2777116 RepID=A0A8S1GRE2_9PELO|nr:unnamed protein product [Caenorhabditis auriculariae]